MRPKTGESLGNLDVGKSGYLDVLNRFWVSVQPQNLPETESL